jgi:hypothetical protein
VRPGNWSDTLRALVDVLPGSQRTGPASPSAPLLGGTFQSAAHPGAASSAAQADAVPAAPAPGAKALPDVHNTFNVTVHLDGGLESEDDLADRLARVLADQARRHGIDVA